MKSIVVGDAKEKLSDLDKGDVVRFFEQVAREMKVRYGQDYSIPGITPLYQLVKYNWPEVRTLEREEGQIVFLGELSEWPDSRREATTSSLRPHEQQAEAEGNPSGHCPRRSRQGYRAASFGFA